MELARVIGNVVATVKHEALVGVKLLLIQPHDHNGEPNGPPIVAADAMQAGVGDTVLAAREGNAARQILGGDADPFHAVILAIVDRIDLAEGVSYRHPEAEVVK